MKRREFLKTTVVIVGATIAGCDDGGSTTPDDAVSDGDALDMMDGMGPSAMADTYFPQSVASGDPRDTSVVIWTRAEDPDRPETDDLEIELEVAEDESFASPLALGNAAEGRLALTARASDDHCIKVRLTELDPNQTYYYRFHYPAAAEPVTTRTGRTKTAPAPDDDVPVRFAFVSCQDYGGKYYNSYKRLLQLDPEVDFIVHLGDYVYETVGDPQFQDVDSERTVTFRNPDDAIVRDTGDEVTLAARSLSNYRDLYRTFRGDSVLQSIHERYPMICTWDDHEFSDDCHGATATYFDGAVDETDVERRKNANQAWFEYMPVDYLEPDFRYDPSVDFPGDIKIYRDLRFGRHLHIAMTDLRTWRSDHLIDEDAFPGEVLMDQTELEAELGMVPSWADPYVDIDTFDGGRLATALQANADATGYAATQLTGVLSASFVNSLVGALNENLDPANQIDPIDETDLATLERGLTTFGIGKSSQFGQLGSRYLAVSEPFLTLAAKRFTDSGGDSEIALGSEQSQWFFDTLESSDATWKIWGNEFTLSEKLVDLATAPVGEFFQKKFRLSVEDWDGLPNRRQAIVDRLADVGNVVAITGDIHSFMAGTPTAGDDIGRRIVEFVCGAISSGTYRTLLLRTASSDPALIEAGAGALAAGIDSLLSTPATGPSPSLAWSNSKAHGFSVVEIDADTLTVTAHQIPEEHVSADLDPSELEALFELQRFRVNSGSPDLQGEFDGEWLTWDPNTLEWA